MKLSSTTMLILLVIFVFAAWGILINDFEGNYIATGISNVTPINETFLQDFGDVEALNASMDPIYEGFKVIATKEGFWDQLLNLAVVIPKAIVFLPGVIFIQITMMIGLISTFSELIGIPVQIIVIAIVGIFMFILFKLVGFWRRTPV